jgi:hypothetical protein
MTRMCRHAGVAVLAAVFGTLLLLGPSASGRAVKTGIAPKVRAVLLEDALAAGALHRESSPYDIQAVRTTEERLRPESPLAGSTQGEQERPSHEKTPFYFVAMKGHFAFKEHGNGGFVYEPVLTMRVFVSTMQVYPLDRSGLQYPNLKALGVPVLLGAEAR